MIVSIVKGSLHFIPGNGKNERIKRWRWRWWWQKSFIQSWDKEDREGVREGNRWVCWKYERKGRKKAKSSHHCTALIRWKLRIRKKCVMFSILLENHNAANPTKNWHHSSTILHRIARFWCVCIPLIRYWTNISLFMFFSASSNYEHESSLFLKNLAESLDKSHAHNFRRHISSRTAIAFLHWNEAPCEIWDFSHFTII